MATKLSRRLAFAFCAMLAGCVVIFIGVWCLGHAFRHAGALVLTVPMLVVGPPVGALVARRLVRVPDCSFVAAVAGSWAGLAGGYGSGLGAWWLAIQSDIQLPSDQAMAVVLLALTSLGWVAGVVIAMWLPHSASTPRSHAA